MNAQQTDVETVYTVTQPVVLYRRDVATSSRPGVVPSFTVTLPGGAVTINGFTYKSDHGAMREFQPGNEYVFLLKRFDDTYRPVQTYLGVFAVSEGRLSHIGSKNGFGREVAHVPSADAIETMIKILQARTAR